MMIRMEFVIRSLDMSHGDNRNGGTDRLKAGQSIGCQDSRGWAVHHNDIRANISEVWLYIIKSSGHYGLVSMSGQPVCQLESRSGILMKDKSLFSFGRDVSREGVHVKPVERAGLTKKKVYPEASPAADAPCWTPTRANLEAAPLRCHEGD